MKINQDRLERANKHVAELLEQYTDQRLQTGIKNVQRACKHHLDNGMPITISSIAAFISKNCSGKPAKGTLDNDSKNVYKPIINSYCDVVEPSRKGNKEKQSTSTSPAQLKVYIKQLENRNAHLEKILDKNFKNQGAISVNSMLNSQIDVQGSVDVSPSSKFSTEEKAAIKKLLSLIELSSDFSIRGEAERVRIVNVSGKVLLKPNEVVLIKNIIEG